MSVSTTQLSDDVRFASIMFPPPKSLQKEDELERYDMYQLQVPYRHRNKPSVRTMLVELVRITCQLDHLNDLIENNGYAQTTDKGFVVSLPYFAMQQTLRSKMIAMMRNMQMQILPEISADTSERAKEHASKALEALTEAKHHGLLALPN